jgi:hypothetical protein
MQKLQSLLQFKEIRHKKLNKAIFFSEVVELPQGYL